MNRLGISKKTNVTNKLSNNSSLFPIFQCNGIPSKKNHFEWINKFPVFIITIFVIMGLTACENDDPGPDDTFDDYCSTPMEVLLKDESNNVTNTHIAYINDFTVANCNAYKAAYNEYLGALYIYRERCELVLTAPAIARMEDAIQSAEREVSSINDKNCE